MTKFPLSRALLGFVSRQEAEEFLKASEVGTFLIRFSDSELGGVTVAWSSCEYTSGVERVIVIGHGHGDIICFEMHNFSERDVSGEGGGDAAALHEEGPDDPQLARQDPRLPPDDQPLPQHPQGSSIWKILLLASRDGNESSLVLLLRWLDAEFLPPPLISFIVLFRSEDFSRDYPLPSNI